METGKKLNEGGSFVLLRGPLRLVFRFANLVPEGEHLETPKWQTKVACDLSLQLISVDFKK